MARARTPLRDRFWPFVTLGQRCWPWTGSVNGAGYGQIHGEGGKYARPLLAHRVSWEMHYGSIPAGLSVLHACDEPACVRPEHLMLGTRQANNIDAGRKGRMGHAHASKTVCLRGRPFNDANTYLWHGHRHCRACQRLTDEGRRRAADAMQEALDG